MSVRWISRSRLSMQRLGFCKAVLAFSDMARTAGQMADVLRTRLEEQKYEVPHDVALATWLRGLHERGETNPGLSISLQNLYIYGHPSQTGWLSRLAFKEYVEFLPQRLALVTDSYEPADMGLVLSRGLMSAEQHEAFQSLSTTNPLVLECGEQIFFLYNLLAADGDFLLALYQALANEFGGDSFDYLDAGSTVPDVIATIVSRFTGAAYTRTDRDQLERLESTAQRIRREIDQHIEKQGSGSRREQTTIPRMEWLVDVGLAKRTASRTWRLTSAGLRMIDLVEAYGAEMSRKYPENVMASVLDSKFFEYVSSAYTDRHGGRVRRDEFLPFVSPAYRLLAGVGGYCLLRPLLLCANIMSLQHHQGLYLEYDEATSLLEDIYQSSPETLHYTIDRYNTDYQVRIERTQ